MSDDADLFRDLRQWAADCNAERHLALYKKTRNGLCVLRAYQEYRRLQLPVPEVILQWIDGAAEHLLAARGQKEIVAALGLTGKGGGPQGASILIGQERQRDIVEAFRDARIANDRATPPRPIKDVAERVGRRFNVSANHVQVLAAQWGKASKGKPASIDIQSIINGIYRKN